MPTRLTGRVIYPNSPGWEDARKNYNERFDVQPKIIVYCQSSEDVANAVKWALENQVPFRVRSGRHSYEGYSLIEGGLVIDLGDMDRISVDQEAGTATIGAGIHMLECSEWLGEVGVTIPLATGITVGLAGLTLGGGFGMTSRKFGLTCDNLLDVELVNARGQIVHANDRENPELFWACKGGGGGNFGIATRFVFRVHPVNLVSIFMIQWDWSQFDQVVDAWQRWAPDTEDGISAVLQLRSDRVIRLYAQYTADPADLHKLEQLLQPLLTVVSPVAPPTIQVLPYLIASRLFFGEDTHTIDPQVPIWSVHVHADQQIYKATSGIAMQPLSGEAIALMRTYLESVPLLTAPPSQPSMIQLLPGGGAPSRVAPDATAFFYRQARFIIQYDSFWTSPEDAEKTMVWVRSFRTAMLPHAKGAYVNYVDSDLTNCLHDYYGDNLDRLMRVKRRYDPQNVFRFPQSIPLAHGKRSILQRFKLILTEF